MIFDSLNRAETAMNTFRIFADNKAAMERYKAQIGRLSQLTVQLEQLFHIVDSIKGEEIATITFPSDMRDSLQHAVDTCGERTNDRRLDAATVDTLKIATESCRSYVENIWKTAVMPSFLESLNSLKTLRALLQNEKEVDRVIASIEKYRDRLPQSDKAVRSFKEDTIKARQMVDHMHLIPEVEVFITKVRGQTATVADLYEEKIDNWIRENHLEKQLKIIF